MAYTGKKPVDHTDVTQSQSMTVTDDLTVDTSTLYVDSTNNRVGINADDTTTATSLANLVVGEYADTASGIALRAGTASALNFEDTSGSTSARVYYNHTSDYMAINTNASERMRIDSSGNVGIGETAPVTPLTIATTNKLGSTFTGTTNGEGLTVTQTNYTAGNYVSLVEAAYDDSGDASPNVRIGAMFDGNGSNLAFGTSNSYGSGITNTAMFIDSTGDVGIGTTSPNGTASNRTVLEVDGTSSVTFGLAINGTRKGYLYHDDSAFYVANQDSSPMSFYTGNTKRMELASGGQLFLFSQVSGAGNATLKYTSGTGAVTYDTSSRLVKSSIVDCPYGLTEVLQLQPRKYFREDDQANEIGFIADDVQSIMSEFVPTGEKSLITGVDTYTEIIPIGVNYEKMVAALTQAIKDLNTKVVALETENATQATEIADLETKATDFETRIAALEAN